MLEVFYENTSFTGDINRCFMRELFNPRHFTCGQLEHDQNKKYPGLILAPLPELPLTE
ncbi:MAG TPA: hypothetical protein PLV91_02395 [Verrucomicrobiota bacterium]|nr:hypothetical protein [Verrucomicrobiota bacterium]